MADLPIILYHYIYSPYAKRVVWYLTLRRIPYFQCLQPAMLPRPDVAQLGIAYRRIPLMSIGRDVYLDTRLILRKLEELYPPSQEHPSISATTGDQRAIERLLSHLAIDAGIFMRATQLLPSNLPMMSDPGFIQDRADLVGVPANFPSPFSKAELDAKRPEAVCEIRDVMALLETTLLADGRDWVLKTDGPTLADIEAVWVFHWLTSMRGALPAEFVSAKQFPRVFAYIERFDKTVKVKEAGRKPKPIKGDEAAGLIVNAAFAEAEGEVDAGDVVVSAEGLRKGDVVRVWPTDSGAAHKTAGKLLKVTSTEIVFEAQGTAGSVRVHAPRHGFRVKKGTGSSKL